MLVSRSVERDTNYVISFYVSGLCGTIFWRMNLISQVDLFIKMSRIMSTKIFQTMLFVDLKMLESLIYTVTPHNKRLNWCKNTLTQPPHEPMHVSTSRARYYVIKCNATLVNTKTLEGSDQNMAAFTGKVVYNCSKCKVSTV